MKISHVVIDIATQPLLNSKEELLVLIPWYLNFLVKKLFFRLHWFEINDTET
jgi:hypothetical protein